MINKIFNFQFSIFNSAKRGFTLVELIIAIALFTLVAFISLGAILTIFDANRKAQSTKTVVDNLNLAIENMARVVRFGSNYYCGASSNISSVNDCSSGDNSLSVTFKGGRIIYRLCGTEIKKSENGDTNCSDNGMLAITSSDTKIEYLRFYVFNTSTSDNAQPYVLAVIKGYVGSRPTTQTTFSIQTLMSQRKLDFNP